MTSISDSTSFVQGDTPANGTYAQKQTPLVRFLALPSVQQAKSYPRGYRLLCPVHGDREESLMAWEDETDGHVGLLCFAGCQRSDICAGLGIREADLYNGSRPARLGGETTRKIDLLDLAVDKLLPPGLFISLHMEDNYTWKPAEKAPVRGVVRIPYLQADGSPYRRSRIRTAVTAKLGSYWEGDEAPLLPYGLWRLTEARKAKTLWLVEGESDCWTLWYHHVPALGIPGARNTQVLQAEHLLGIDTLYIVQEPADQGKADAGKAFVDGVCSRLKDITYSGEVFVVSLKQTHQVKDPNDLHKKLFTEKRLADFPTELRKAIHNATPLTIQSLSKQEQLAALQPLVDAAIVAQDTTTLYDLAPRIAKLSTKEQAQMITLVKQGMKSASGFSLRAFNKLLKETTAAIQHHLQPSRVTNKPDIFLSGDLEQDSQNALMALYTANTPPRLFLQRGTLVRCRTDEEGKPCIEELTEAILLYELVRSANFFSYSQGKETFQPTYPPLPIARHLLAQGTWQFPVLRGVTEVPIIREDGTILDQPGYDPKSKLLYIPHSDLVIPPIPQHPTRQEVEAARDLAWSYIAEFPYETTADAANAFGLLLTVVIRSLVDLVPMALIDSTKQGTGKGLLAKFIAYIAGGRPAASMVVPHDENEWRKTLTSLLLEGETLISLDNIEGLFYSPTLASFLTADTWKARLLGTMQSPDLLQRTMMLANGNNLELGGDLPRRSYRIRMDAGVSQPWMRTGFTYSPLLKYAKQDRGKIIAALLTLVRAWYVAGKPAPVNPPPALAEFSAWAEIISGVLAFAGVSGFLENLKQLYEETDRESPQWSTFLDMWLTTLGSRTYTTAQIIEALQKDKDFEAILPEYLAGAHLTDEKERKAFSVKLGKALRKRKGTPYGQNNIRLEMTKDAHAKQNVWYVIAKPVTDITHPVRVVWKEDQNSSAQNEADKKENTPSTKCSDDTPDTLPTELAVVCQAPGCQIGPLEDDGFLYDQHGHAWCSEHKPGDDVVETG